MVTNAPVASLFNSRQVWQQRRPRTGELLIASAQPTGWPQLDAVLPAGGWPDAALTEILLPADGVGELQLLMPTLARLSCTDRPVLLIAPPYAPCVAGWRVWGVDMAHVEIVAVEHERQVLWAAEQSLRAGCCSAVLAWPKQIDERHLRRLQVAADSGRALAFVFRDRKYVEHASPAALRIEIETDPAQLRVRKCRGGAVPAMPIAFEADTVNSLSSFRAPRNGDPEPILLMMDSSKSPDSRSSEARPVLSLSRAGMTAEHSLEQV